MNPAHLFPCMRDNYPWSDSRPDVPDSRVPAKANTEYHGYQSYGGQYAAQAMYDEASKNFRSAADSRKDLMKALPQLADEPHLEAQKVCECLANYYQALSDWQKNPDMKNIPQPEKYSLSKKLVEHIEAQGKAKIEGALQ